jgi:hypothetical protein
LEQGQLRKVIRKALMANDYQDVEENIDLMFIHLKRTKRMTTSEMTMSDKSAVKIVKLAQIGQTFESAEIDANDKAPYMIREKLSILEQDI